MQKTRMKEAVGIIEECMPYRYLENIATVDVAFEVEGRTLEELFRDAAIATFEVMVDAKSVEPRITREIELK